MASGPTEADKKAMQEFMAKNHGGAPPTATTPVNAQPAPPKPASAQ